MTLPYTPEFLAHLRQRYEETDEPVTSIAADYEIDEKTVYRIARRSKWRMRSARRALPRHIQLLDAARAEAIAPVSSPASECSSVRPRESGDPDLWIPASAGMSGERNTRDESPSALDRLEQLVLKEIAIEETRRDALGSSPRPPAEAAHTARALSTLVQTLQAIERLRHDQESPTGNPDDPTDDIPANIDEFRSALARRINAFVAGRTDVRHAETGGEPEMVDEAR